MSLPTAQLRADLARILGREPAVRPGPELVAPVDPARLPEVARALRTETGAVFADLFGLDARDGSGGGRQLHLVFALDRANAWLHLVAELSDEPADYPALTPELPAAGWYERELWDELGIEPKGHPALVRLRLPADWPRDAHPLERDFRWREPVPAVGKPDYPKLAPAPDGVVDYPLGPVRSGVVESVHYTLRTVGEELVDLRLLPFHKHRGAEKLAEGLPIAQLPLVAERISGTSAFAHSLALCQALEAAAGVTAPPRARALRTLLAELERTYNHLGYHADLCQATGLVVGQAQFDILRERLLRLNATLAGHRYLFGMNVPGGLARDLNAGMLAATARAVSALRHELGTLEPMLLNSSSHLDRLEGTGILRPEDAWAYGAVGPTGRASGVERDLRRDHPYAAYGEVDFAVPVYETGDALARARVRLAELRESLRIIEQILDRTPGGTIRVPLPELTAGATGLGWVESPRGEGFHWILVGEDGTLSRYRVRTASFANAQVFPLAVPGHNILTDFPIIEQSFALSIAGCDR